MVPLYSEHGYTYVFLTLVTYLCLLSILGSKGKEAPSLGRNICMRAVKHGLRDRVLNPHLRVSVYFIGEDMSDTA